MTEVLHAMGSSSTESYTVQQMQPLKAHVKNGHLVVEELAELPEGQVFYLVPVQDDDLDDDERTALHAVLDASVAAAAAGDVYDADNVLDELDRQLRSEP
jgi:hypothetical protein